MPLTFHTPPRFHPGYAPLYRWLHRWTEDRLQAGALHILVLAGAALGLLLVHFVAWAVLQVPLHDWTDPQALQLWGVTLGGLALIGGLGLVGVQPAVTVRCTHEALHLEQGHRQRTLPYDALQTVDVISATTYHRHYRLYARTHPFIGIRGERLVLLRTAENVVVIGLTASDQQALRTHLETAPDAARTEDALAS